MSRKYKFRDPEAVYICKFAILICTINWIDVFTRRVYKDIIVDSLNYCIENKGLIVYAWVLMSNHAHLIIESIDEPLQNIMRDMKKIYSKRDYQSN
jgi:putative transposase